jgi:peptide/nickel transport system substrate-binding protein
MKSSTAAGLGIGRVSGIDQVAFLEKRIFGFRSRPSKSSVKAPRPRASLSESCRECRQSPEQPACYSTSEKHNWLTFAGAFSAVFALGLLALVAACGRGRSGRAGDKSTVNFLIESAPTNLDPRIGTDAQSQHIDALIFSSLLAHDPQMNVVPDLATSWAMPDPLTYVFHLRGGVKFHDGRPLEAADVKYTFDSILSGTVKTGKRGAFRAVNSVEAYDPQTVIFHLREPDASLLWNLTRPGVGIVPRGDTPSEMTTHPIGTGPFRFVSSAVDEDIVLARNADFYAGPAQIERLRLRIIPDVITRALELRKGSADAEINTLTPDMYRTLATERDIAVDEAPGTPVQYIAFNCENAILSRREVRQALSYATDRAALIRYLLRGQARPASSLLPPNHWAYEPDVRKYDYDPKRAEAMLNASGFQRGADGVRFHLTMKTSTDASTRLLGEALAEEWSHVGVALDLRSMEYATFYSDITDGSFQLYTQRWVGGNNDPDIFQYVFSSKKTPPDGANRGRYRNATLDALLDEQAVELDREKRKALLSQIQKIVAEDEPYLVLWYTDNVCAHRKRLEGVELSLSGDYEFLKNVEILGRP